MKALFALILAATPLPALAQETDHSTHHAPSPQPAPPAAEITPPPPADDPHSGHEGHDTAPAAADARGADQAPGSAEPPPVANDSAASRYWDPAAMAAAAEAEMHPPAPVYSKVQFDLAEYAIRNGEDGYRWEGEAWIGDLTRVVLKSEGEGDFGGELERAEVQLLYSKALDPWWNLQFGVRQEIRPRPMRTHAAVAIEGLAPYFFHVTAAGFLSHRGEVTGRIEASYDQRITQRLILQPRGELNLSAQDIPVLRTGAGLTEAELGFRLRYELKKEFASYVGVAWTWLSGKTADFARTDGRDTRSRSIVAGVRAWF